MVKHPQYSFEQVDIAQIEFDPRSRDDILAVGCVRVLSVILAKRVHERASRAGVNTSIT